MMIVLPMIQNNQSLTIGFFIINYVYAVDFLCYELSIHKIFRYKIVFMEE